MVKVILDIYPVVRAESQDERAALRPLGRNSERYQETLLGTFDLVQAADDLGLWGVATIEHHFHSEGYEVSPNPGVLNAYWAAITKQIHVGQLGYVMSAQHPIRVAEETAILDHMSQGRFFVGFARGYQDRWTNVIGQHLGARATHSDGTADDQTNRDLFEENVDIVLKAWTQDSIEHNSPLWQIPYPHEEGIEWWMARSTSRLGADGEIGSDGRVHRVSVVPAPYQKPHPPVFVPSLGSPASADYCARQGFVYTHVIGGERALVLAPRYVTVAKDAGRHLALGQSQAVERFLQIGATREDTERKLASFDSDIYKNFYDPLYQLLDPDLALPPDPTTAQIVQALQASQMHVSGTVDEVRDQLVAEWAQVPYEYIIISWHYAQQPKESVIEQLEIFMREIKPALDELTAYERAAN